ncbi:MAG TPA: maleylpyruvate isomerase N-terminal domain-containing protein [Acidimicrobiia bacterium]
MAVVTDRTVALLPEWPAFAAAVTAAHPTAGTACEAWTTRDVVAHNAGNAEEITRTLRAHLEGAPVPPTRSFEERETPYLAMGDPALLGALTERVEQLGATLEEALAGDVSAPVPWTGRQMKVSSFPTHMRNELALHRWDVVGDDEVSERLLDQPELTRHAVEAVGRPLLVRGMGRVHEAPQNELRLRAHGRDDVVLRPGSNGVELSLAPPDGDAVLETDASARVLLLWGRQPCDTARLRSRAGRDTLGLLRTLLSGY